MDKFYRVEYTGKIKRTGDIFDTTDEEVAKEKGVHNEKMEYGPRDLTSEEELIEGVMEHLKDMEEGEEKEFTVQPEKGYGKRDPSKVEMVPKKDFEDTDVTPVPGMQVILDGQPAKIQTVSGGRVRVDFNNPLAGKDLEYNLKVLKIFKEDEEKAKILIKKELPVSEEEVRTQEQTKKETENGEETQKNLKIQVPLGTFGEDEEEEKEQVKEKIREKTSYEDIEIKEEAMEEEEEGEE